MRKISEALSVLKAAPDLNLANYSTGQIKSLVAALNTVYIIFADEPPSAGTKEHAGRGTFGGIVQIHDDAGLIKNGA